MDHNTSTNKVNNSSGWAILLFIIVGVWIWASGTHNSTSYSTIPCAYLTVKSSSLTKGKQQVTQSCIPGSKASVHKISNWDGSDKGVVNSYTAFVMQPQITVVGTAEPIKFTLPSTTSSTSLGPTALCADGTYSYSANHQGTCSWHGGVSVWYR